MVCGVKTLFDHRLSFVVGQKPTFQVSLDDLSRVEVGEDNQVSLKFHKDDTTYAKEKVGLQELVFAFPGKEESHEFKEKIMEKENMLVENKRGEKALVDFETLEEFQEKVMGLQSVQVEDKEDKKVVAEFENVSVVTLRGQYGMKLYLKKFQLVGNGNKLKIMYKDITSIFVLPRSEFSHAVVLSLDPSLSSGQTEHPFITLEFKENIEVEKFLTMDEDVYASRFVKRLKKEYKGVTHDVTHDVLVSLLEGLSRKEAIRHSDYRSHNNSYAVNCSFKAEKGLMYPLDKGFFCLTANPVHISYDDINDVDIVSGKVGHFNLRIALKTRTWLLFSSIRRDELQWLLVALRRSGLKIKDLQDEKDKVPRERNHEEEQERKATYKGKEKREDAPPYKMKMTGKGKDVTENSQSERPAEAFSEAAQKDLDKQGVQLEFHELKKHIAREWDKLPEHLKSFYRSRDGQRTLR